MPSRTAPIVCLAATVAASVAAAHQSPNVLQKDVVIIGGGSSGAYAAVRLRDDYGKSIALVEMRDSLVRNQRPIHASSCTK
jgi:choline dehydrogenase-like flavoprotein